MKGIEGFIQTNQLAESIRKKMGIQDTLVGLITSQQGFAQRFQTENTILNSLQSIQQKYKSPFLNDEGITGLLAFTQKNKIPHSIFESISSISSFQQQLFDTYRPLASENFIFNPIQNQISSLQAAMAGISKDFALSAAIPSNWSALQEFGAIAEKAITIAEEQEISEEGINLLEKLVDYVCSIYVNNRQLRVKALTYVEIVIIFITLHQYYDFLKPKSESISKEEFVKFEKRIIKRVEERLRKENEYRITNRPCKIRLKPQNKSLVLIEIPKGFEVIVLQNSHKWAYISYSDNSDNLPQTGWVLKKYLERPR